MNTEQLKQYLADHDWTTADIAAALDRLVSASDCYRFGIKAKEVPDFIQETRHYLNRILTTLNLGGGRMSESFWRSTAGQLIIEAQFWIAADDFITAKSATELIYGTLSHANFERLRATLTPIRKPELECNRDPLGGVYGFLKSQVDTLR